MITIVIGQSGAGKTSFVRSLLKGQGTVKEDGIYFTEFEDGIIALGKYGVGIRTEGTDTLPYNAKEKIKTFIEEHKDRNIVMEGDRITNKDIFEFVARLRVPVKLYIVTCSLGESMRRLRAAGSSISITFVKATKTKSKRLFFSYSNIFHGEVINTDGN